MKRVLFAALITLAAAPAAQSDVPKAVSSHILPGFARFAEAALRLDDAAQSDCRPAGVRPAFHSAFDAWMRVADLRLGPSETGALSISFWPDDRGSTPRALAGLIASEDPIGRDRDAFIDMSIAARGSFAMEMLLYDPAFAGYGLHDYSCDLVKTVAADLSRQATDLDREWSEGFARTLTTAGAADNATYLSKDEAVRAIYTRLLASLQMTADSRLGRPMGTFDHPHPKMAESWRSARSLQNVMLATKAANDLAHALADSALPVTDAAFAQVLASAARVKDPGFQDIAAPQARLRVEVLQQAIRSLSTAIKDEIGTALGIAPGFNSADGD